LLVFWIDQRRHGRFLKNSTAVDAWDGDYDLNQQWSSHMLGSHAIMIMSPEFMKPLRCYQYAVGFIIASDRNNATNPMPYDIPVAMHMRHYMYALRQPVFYQAKTATVNGTTIDLGVTGPHSCDVPKKRTR
jgi:hypothetical protein